MADDYPTNTSRVSRLELNAPVKLNFYKLYDLVNLNSIAVRLQNDAIVIVFFLVALRFIRFFSFRYTIFCLLIFVVYYVMMISGARWWRCTRCSACTR